MAAIDDLDPTSGLFRKYYPGQWMKVGLPTRYSLRIWGRTKLLMASPLQGIVPNLAIPGTCLTFAAPVPVA
jgi:hypothetical protein